MKSPSSFKLGNLIRFSFNLVMPKSNEVSTVLVIQLQKLFFALSYNTIAFNQRTALVCFKKHKELRTTVCLPSYLWLSLIGMRGDTFISLSNFGSDFVSWIFIKNFQTYVEVKIDINWVNLTVSIWHPAKLISSYKKCP